MPPPLRDGRGVGGDGCREARRLQAAAHDARAEGAAVETAQVSRDADEAALEGVRARVCSGCDALRWLPSLLGGEAHRLMSKSRSPMMYSSSL